MDVFQHTQMGWISTIILVAMKDLTLRICVDYRTLDWVMVWDSYAILGMGECISSPVDAKIISTKDDKRSYWQVNIAKADRDKTVFTSLCGRIWFKCKPSRLKNALGTFQQKMNVILVNVKWHFAFVYLDDIVIYFWVRQTNISIIITSFDVNIQSGSYMEPKGMRMYFELHRLLR